MPGILAREFPDNFECPIQVWSAAGMPGRSYDHRDAGVQRLANHDAEIAFGAFAWTTRFSRSQIVRPRIRGARIAADEVRALLDGTDKSFLSKARAQISSGR